MSVIEIFERLRPYFQLIDWRTSSCALPLDAFQNARPFAITLVRPRGGAGADLEVERLSAFAQKLKAMCIWSGVADVRTRLELETALRAGAQFLSGRAVSGPTDVLAARSDVDVGDLPLGEPVRPAA